MAALLCITTLFCVDGNKIYKMVINCKLETTRIKQHVSFHMGEVCFDRVAFVCFRLYMHQVCITFW